MISVARLMAEGRPPGAPVAIDGDAVVDWATFTAHVARLAALLASRGPGRWLLYTENSYAFAVGLAAIWQAGAVAVLAPNGQPGALAEVGRNTLGLITEGIRHVPGLDHIAALHATGPVAWPWTVLGRGSRCLELFTSGSTGHRKPVSKTLANLEDEVAGLERQWGTLLQDRQVFSTVSHQHIYGLLFRILWPLAAGRTFRADTHLHPDEMAAAMIRAHACFLVASPAHLSRLTGFAGIERLAAHCRPVFSSGASLDGATADALRQAFGEAPFEIFGSTETGGVAWRQQDARADAQAWTLFADVTATTDPPHGLLRIRSPFVDAVDGAFTMADRVEFRDDGRFVVGPRSDRIVKIGDTRLSLPEMEAALSAHPFVAQAALVVLDVGAGDRVGAAIVPAPSGREALARQGRRGVSQSLLQSLEPYWDRILLPRVWRYVSRLPQDPQGKTTVAELSALFASPYDSAIVTPEVLAQSAAGGVWQQTLRVPETLGWLDGHFPGLPVVPGVAQIQWAMDLVRAMTGGEVALERMETVKFKHVLRPGDVFHLRVERSAAGDHVGFRLWNERAVFSSGRGILAFPRERQP